MNRAKLAEINHLVELEACLERDLDFLQMSDNRNDGVGVLQFIDERAMLGEKLLQLRDGSFPRQPGCAANYWVFSHEVRALLRKYLLRDLDECRERLKNLGIENGV